MQKDNLLLCVFVRACSCCMTRVRCGRIVTSWTRSEKRPLKSIPYFRFRNLRWLVQSIVQSIFERKVTALVASNFGKPLATLASEQKS